MATTKDEQPVEEVVNVTKTTTKKEVEKLYNDGVNIYDIATQVYGFDSEDAVKQIKRLLGKEELI